MLPNPLTQSDAFARTLRALGTDVRIDAIAKNGRCLIQTRRIPLLGQVNLISRGPLGLDMQARQSYLAGLDVKGPLIINSTCALVGSGFLRLSKPKTIALLDLGQPDWMLAAMHQNWRNALSRARRSGIGCDLRPYDPMRHKWLIDAEERQQTTKGYRNWPHRFLDTYARENPDAVQVATGCQSGTPIAAMLFLCHAPWATYHLGVTTGPGRDADAHCLTLWTAMTWLAARDYRTLDLGLLSGPPGLDRFKRRCGAKAHSLGGTWLRLPRLMRQFPSIQLPSGQKA